jgi:hypothetical protein
MEETVALHVTFANIGTEKEPSLYVKIEEGKARPNTWYRKRIVYECESKDSILPPLVRIESTRHDLEDIAKAAFELGRSVERAIQVGTPIGVD